MEEQWKIKVVKKQRGTCSFERKHSYCNGNFTTRLKALLLCLVAADAEGQRIEQRLSIVKAVCFTSDTMMMNHLLAAVRCARACFSGWCLSMAATGGSFG